MAYGVKRYQVEGEDWIVNLGGADRYDVVATSAAPVSADEMMRMLAPVPDLARGADGGWFHQNWSMTMLADWRSGLPSLGRPVIDRTGMEDSFSSETKAEVVARIETPDDSFFSVLSWNMRTECPAGIDNSLYSNESRDYAEITHS